MVPFEIQVSPTVSWPLNVKFNVLPVSEPLALKIPLLSKTPSAKNISVPVMLTNPVDVTVPVKVISSLTATPETVAVCVAVPEKVFPD